MFDDDVLVSNNMINYIKILLIIKERRRLSIERKVRIMRGKIRRYKSSIKTKCS